MSGKTIAITGRNGFLGRNAALRLEELGHRIVGLGSDASEQDWVDAMQAADVVIHLAGANRPEDPQDFERVNKGSAETLVRIHADVGRPTPVLYASSIRAEGNDTYGLSKRAGEDVLLRYMEETATPVFIFRLPNVFGKWARPNYNSAVATFCHNIARGLPIEVHDPSAPLQLVYVDDVVQAFIDVIENPTDGGFREVSPVYATTVGEVAELIRGFGEDREGNLIDDVGTGLVRALYATYVAALPPEEFSYPLVSHKDARGAFSEVLKTRTAGQFSYFTALPGVTRGGHYHHTKTEKFLIVKGRARFGFRHMITGETFEILTSEEAPEVVQTVPGWSHDVTNIGDDMLISLLWANEIFDREKPDTIAAEVAQSGAGA